MRIIYENVPFDCDSTLAHQLGRLLGGNFKLVGDGYGKVLRTAGTLSMPGGPTISIRSKKAPAAGLLAWAAYASPELSALRWVRPIHGLGQDGDLTSVAARTFCEELQSAVNSAGVLRRYRRRSETSQTIRGRVDFARLVRLGGSLSSVPCEVFARLPNTALNRVFAYTLNRTLRNPLMRRAAGPRLGPLLAAFGNVHASSNLEADLAALALDRFERPFAASLALARFILRGLGVAEGKGGTSLGFLVNLANLFEGAVARAFADSAFAASPKRRLRYQRCSEDGWSHAGSMEVDVFLAGADEGRPVIVDAKYKSAPSSANLQQVVTYCWMTGSRQAILVFPAGVLVDRRPFRYRARGGDAVTVHMMEMACDAHTLDGWNAAASRLIADVAELLHSGSEQTPTDQVPANRSVPAVEGARPRGR